MQVFSAGTDPTFVHSLAVAVMKELGINISRQQSNSSDEFEGEKFDFLITLCDHAAESCPVFLAGRGKFTWAFAAFGRHGDG